MNSGLEARNSLFLIHAVTQTLFTTWTNYFVSPFSNFCNFSNIMVALCFDISAVFRLGKKRVRRDITKNTIPIFSLFLYPDIALISGSN